MNDRQRSILSEQEIFDQVVSGIISQAGPSLSHSTRRCGGSFYRGAGRTKCAAGMLIDDEDYLPAMEGITFAGLIKKYPRRFNQFVKYRRLIDQLQVAHDKNSHLEGHAFLAAFLDSARKIALDFSLTPFSETF
jgi:hypothetical protein